jgi:hypothetical protein
LRCVLPVRSDKQKNLDMTYLRHLLAGLTIALLLTGTSADAQTPEPPDPDTPRTTGAVLQGLDKVTARISTFEVPLERLVAFGTLTIQVRACHKTPPTEAPESTAFLEIDESFESGSDRRIFTGWMFASSPAVSALEHPVYDVWVVDCMKASSSDADKSG